MAHQEANRAPPPILGDVIYEELLHPRNSGRGRLAAAMLTTTAICKMYLPSLPDGAGAVEGRGGRAGARGLVGRVVHALSFFVLAHRRRQGHAVII